MLYAAFLTLTRDVEMSKQTTVVSAQAEKAISICQAAAKLCVSETHVRRLIKKGILKVPGKQRPQAVFESSVLSLKQKLDVNGVRKAKSSLSIPQMAVRIGVSTDYIRALIVNGTIDAQLIGRQFYIPAREAEKFLA
jgi:excisionase family DNA binding protein